MGDILSMHGACLYDAVGWRAGLVLQDAVYFSHGTVHADVRVLQSSCVDDAVWPVYQEEGVAVACADSGVCLS